nr:MAG: DnaB-like helicase C terminal domain [Bacteriophage sp.]
MDAKLLLVRSITLLYLESRRLSQYDNSAVLVREIVNGIKLSENAYDLDDNKLSQNELRKTVLWMVDQPLEHTYDHTGLLQRIRINIKGDDSLWDSFRLGLTEPETQEELEAKISEIRTELESYQQKTRFASVIKQAQRDCLFNFDNMDVTAYFSELQNKLDAIKPTTIKAAFEAVTSFGSNNRGAVADAVQKAVEQSSPEGVLTLGWQGVNRMMGELKGIRRGDMVVVGALTNNFKTGFTLSMFRQMCMHNVPYMLDSTKKPLMLHISTENSQEDNMIIMYCHLYEDEFQTRVDVDVLKEEAKTNPQRYQEIADYVMDKLTRTGYNVEFIRLNGPTTTYDKIFQIIKFYESQGYEIHAIVFDYLNMCSKQGCHASTIGGDVRELFRIIRSYTNPKGIAFITPHQISSEAYNLLRMNTDDFVKQIAKKGYWDSCKVLQQEVDLEILLHIEVLYGKSYLTIHRGKHRKPLPTPPEDHYCVLPFAEFGCIPDDINGADRSQKKFGSDAPDHTPEWM